MYLHEKNFGIWIIIGILWSCNPTVTQQPIPAVALGDFESLPGGRGNIAEFGKALRLPTILAEKNIVQFYEEGGIYYHRFLFDNTNRTLSFPFTFGETKTIQIHDKTIEYSYVLETTGDPYRATIFARYEEQNGIMRFTVEAVFTRSGMVSTYTHSDVLDSIMARRSYRRLVPKAALGYYENVANMESSNFQEFARALPLPERATFGPNSKIYIGQSSRHFMIKYLLDPESYQITFPFVVGERQKKFLLGNDIEYMVDVEKGKHPNITVIRAQFRQEGGNTTYMTEFVIAGKEINATYQRANVTAVRVYRRALPLHFYGTFVAVPEGEENFAEFNSIFQDSSLDLAKSAAKIRFYRQGNKYHQEIMSLFGMTESTDISFELSVPTEREVLGKPYKVLYFYEGGEKPTLYGSFENTGGELSFTVEYIFSGNGVMGIYRRSGLSGPITAKRFYRRQLPVIIFGRYESVDNSAAFKSFANGIFFPELTSKTTMEYLEQNGTYVQKFSYGPEVSTTFQEIQFIIGEKHTKLVKNKWQMEYTYNVWEGERTFLISLFTEKVTGSDAPTFGEFSRMADFTKDGYTAVYTFGNLTAVRNYKRLH